MIAVPLRRLGAPLLACATALSAQRPVSQASAISEWPQWRGPDRDAVSRESGLLTRWGESGPTLAWKTSGLGTGFSSLAIAGGRIFTMGDLDGAQHVIALDLDGKRLWTARVGPALEHDYPGPRGTPTVDGDLLYAIGTDGDLVCLETATGRERWRRSLVRDFGGRMMSGWRFSESPLVDGDKLVFTPGGADAGLAAVDRKTGKEIWRSAIPALGPKGRDGAAYSSIVASEGAGIRQYVQLMGRGLVGVRASDGKFLWGYNRIANETANISTPIARHHFVFASTGYQTGSVLLELTRAGGGVAAREVYFLDGKTLQNHHGGLVLVGNHVYGGQGHRMGLPICVEFTTGKVAWGGDIRNAGSGSAAVLYADGHLYFRYENGLVMLIEATPEGYRERGSFAIPGVRRPSWSHLVIVDGKLYAREQDALYVYDVRKG
jgi:outer membrane protein assembly factor BamB